MNARTYHPDGSEPTAGQVFVYGSNLSGIHGAGAAKAALNYYGAKWGLAEGISGRSYAIPTVQHKIAGPLTPPEIAVSVARFLAYAEAHPDTEFLVTRIGCGLAGHRDSDVAPMFADAPENCSLPDTWRRYLIGDKR